MDIMHRVGIVRLLRPTHVFSKKHCIHDSAPLSHCSSFCRCEILFFLLRVFDKDCHLHLYATVI